MSAGARLAAFAVVLGLAVVGGAAIGAAVDGDGGDRGDGPPAHERHEPTGPDRPGPDR